MVIKLLLNKLIKLHLLNILLSQFIILIKLLRVLMPQGIARNVQVRQEPVIQLLIPYHLIMNHLNVLSRHEVVNHEVLQFQLLLQNPTTLLQRLDLLCVHLLELLVLVLKVFESAEFLFDLEGLVLILLLEGLVHLVGIVHNVLLLLQVLLNLALVLPLLLQLLQLPLQLISLMNSGLFLLVAMQHLLLHLLQLLYQGLLVLLVQLLLLLFLLDLFQDLAPLLL